MHSVDDDISFAPELLLPTEFDFPLDIEIFFMNDTYLAKQSLLSTSGY
jgi:hypothetical protein